MLFRSTYVDSPGLSGRGGADPFLYASAAVSSTRSAWPRRLLPMLSETSSRDTSSASPAVTTCVGFPWSTRLNRQLTLHPPRTEAGFPPQAGSPRPPPCQAPPQQGTLLLPSPQDRRAQEEVRPRMHRRCRRSRPRPRCRQAGRERHPRLDRPGPPQEAWTQGAFSIGTDRRSGS